MGKNSNLLSDSLDGRLGEVHRRSETFEKPAEALLKTEFMLQDCTSAIIHRKRQSLDTSEQKDARRLGSAGVKVHTYIDK